MSRFQAIENKLSSLNGAVFQELCDSYLKLKNKNYLAFSRIGSQTGKQKTTRGTPDSFFLLPNGNYLFIEITTDISTKNKLSNDIKACFEFKKTKIPINKIEEIVLCFNWNIDQKELLKLNKLARGYNNSITVRYIMLQELAIELHLNHRDLAHEYLGLPLDTGQIVSREKFIAEYNKASNRISTPIDNTFLHREDELEKLKTAILSNDFIILTGSAGIGKTKLALEGIKSFLAENLSYGAYCVSYKHHTLLDDLYQYFDSDKDYILFVDDANRIDAFSQITGFYKSTRKGKLKILMTVRDYAFQEVGMLCQEFSPVRFDLEKFTDEQIVDIIKAEPFEILNPDYHKEIIKIADGNPRIAIMTALLAKAKQNIYALSDVSDLFENYFSTFVKDDGEFAETLTVKCLGLISFFYTIPYKEQEITSGILKNFDIEYSSFIDSIDKLDMLELVEIQYEHVKIPEQNLSTFFFYKAFVKDNILSFKTLLDNYFDNNSSRFKDCVIPANNTFGSKKVMDKLQPFLKSHWLDINVNEERAFNFLSTFWFYLTNETLEFLHKHIMSLPENLTQDFDVEYGNNDFTYNKNKVIELLGEFFQFPSEHLKDVIELSFEYVRKEPSHLPELIYKIRAQMTFDREDERYRFKRQITLFDILIDGLNRGDSLMDISFFALSKTFLSSKFQHTKGGRNNSFYWYYYEIPNNIHIQKFRKRIWAIIDSIFEKHPTQSFDLLDNYSNVGIEGFSENILQFDLPFVISIIDNHLTPNSFEHCRYVQNLIRWYTRNLVSHPTFSSLLNRFINSTYEAFLKIDWDRFRDKEMYEFDDYREYEKLKEAEIRNSFIFKELTEIKDFYKTFIYLKNVAKNDWSYNNTLDLIIDENYSKNTNIGCKLLEEVITNNNEVSYTPRILFINNLKTKESANRIWALIQDNDFKYKKNWELAFYNWLGDNLINEEQITRIINTVQNLSNNNTIHFGRLKRFLSIQPSLFQDILRSIYEKNVKEDSNLQVWMDFFSDHFDDLGNDIDLIKNAYLQQNKIQNHFDYDGKGFFNILKISPNFLMDYVGSLYSERQLRISTDNRNLGFVWKIENIEDVLKDVFDLIVEKEIYLGFSDHFCNSFFRNLEGDIKKRAESFLYSYCKVNFSDSSKMNVIVDIARHSMKEIFEEILLLFISLSQEKDLFSKIRWRGNGTSGTGDIILADIEMADWKNIQTMVEKSDAGMKLIPIKTYINEQIEYCKKSGDWERQRRFLSKW